MKLNFKALVSSLVICFNQFITLPLSNISVSAMEVEIKVNRSGHRFYQFNNIIYGISARGNTVKILKCPENILTYKVLEDVLYRVNNIHDCYPEKLFLDKNIKSISISENEFEKSHYLYNRDRTYRPVHNLVRKIAIYGGSRLDNSIQMYGSYCDMFRRLERNTGLHFGYYDPKRKAMISYDYELYPLRRVTDYGGGGTRFVETYEYWSDKETELLTQACEQSTNLEDLYKLATQMGINRNKNSILSKAYKLGWKAIQ